MKLCLTPLTLLMLHAPIDAQRPAPSESHSIPEIASELADSDRSWKSFLTRSSLSCGIYRLPAGATDGQSPHDRDEVYQIMSGRAVLEVGSTRHVAQPGTVLFVAAGQKHRFVDIEEDLTALVFFSEATATRGGMAAGPRPTEQTPYDEASQRGSARVFYWFGSSSAGQLDIHYGRPAWNPQYAKFLTQPSGRRWRLGENFWTTLDTNIPIEVGGVPLGIGQYYLVLQNSADDGLRLIALDPQAVRERRLDAYEASKTTGGTSIPLTPSGSSAPAARLAIELVVDRSEAHRADLHIRFGPHRFSAPVVMKPGSAK